MYDPCCRTPLPQEQLGAGAVSPDYIRVVADVMQHPEIGEHVGIGAAKRVAERKQPTGSSIRRSTVCMRNPEGRLACTWLRYRSAKRSHLRPCITAAAHPDVWRSRLPHCPVAMDSQQAPSSTKGRTRRRRWRLRAREQQHLQRRRPTRSTPVMRRPWPTQGREPRRWRRRRSPDRRRAVLAPPVLLTPGRRTRAAPLAAPPARRRRVRVVCVRLLLCCVCVAPVHGACGKGGRALVLTGASSKGLVLHESRAHLQPRFVTPRRNNTLLERGHYLL